MPPKGPPPRSGASATKPPRLVLRFALYAGVAVLLTAALALVLVRVNARAEAERDVWNDAQYVAEELGRDDLAGSAFVRPVGGAQNAQLDDLLLPLVSARRLTRVSLISPAGTITYSTDHALIGRGLSGQTRARARAATAGRDWFGTTSGDGPRLVESYVPVRWLLGGQEHAAGSLVAARDYGAVAREIRSAVLFQSATVLLALLVLYLALLPILRRVTATLEAQNEWLRESEARYRALTEQASDGILVLDPDGRLLDANASLAEMIRSSRDELIGMDVRDLIEPADLMRLPLRLPELREGKTVLQERCLRRKDGSSFYGEFHATMLSDGRIHASLRDVSARKRLEHELRRAHSGELHARLATGVADDFARLIEGIQHETARLLDRLEPDDPLREPAVEIQDSTAWGASLVQQLLAFGKRQELHPSVVDPVALVSRLEQMIRILLGKRVDLALELAPTDRIEVDLDQLEQVVIDLVLHARDSMPRGGTLTIRTSNVEFLPMDGEDGRGGGRFVMLAISDTGSAGEARRFAPYSVSEGDGLIGPGLAAVYGIVHQSGGSIGLDSEPEQGTTVRVYLPSVDAAARNKSALRAV